MFTPAGAFIRNAPAVGAGYAAEMSCAGVFVMGRNLDEVIKNDILPVNPLLKHADIAVDRTAHSVTASLFHLAERSALFRPGLGCTLVGVGGVAALQAQAEGLTPMEMRDRPLPWPAGDQAAVETSPALAKALDDAFSDGTDTRAMIVLLGDKIVAERYAPGFDGKTRFLGWSMSKSVASALAGTLALDNKLALDQPAAMPVWKDASDGRQSITPRQLLEMASGLHFSETYSPGDDATAMLYREDDMAAYAASRPLDHPPGSSWSYSSGSTNIVDRLVFDAAGGTAAGVYNYARVHLFEPAGMTSAVWFPDASGNLVGSSYLYMTARDWARFGLLYLNGGKLGWQRILSEQWVDDSHRPARLADGRSVAYGLAFWLNSDGTAETPLRLPDCPADLYMAEGHNGQVMAVVPSEHAVLLRLGWTTGEARFDTNRHFVAILEALRGQH
jgi:CubicO group peptidase (beta-lactamase class C family)